MYIGAYDLGAVRIRFHLSSIQHYKLDNVDTYIWQLTKLIIHLCRTQFEFEFWLINHAAADKSTLCSPSAFEIDQRFIIKIILIKHDFFDCRQYSCYLSKCFWLCLKDLCEHQKSSGKFCHKWTHEQAHSKSWILFKHSIYTVFFPCQSNFWVLEQTFFLGFGAVKEQVTRLFDISSQFISSVTIHPSIHQSVRPLIAYAATSVSDSVI